MSLNQTPRIISQATLFAYQLPFKNTMQFKQYELRYREGVILQLRDNSGHFFVADIAPLPGFSHETLTDVKNELIQQLPDIFDRPTQYQSAYNCVQFALDNLFSLDTQLSKIKSIEIEQTALLQGDEQQVTEQYLKLNKPNLIKLKVAREAVENDINCFRKLCELNPKIKIRCDANQAWTELQAISFFSSIKKQNLDYIEEPTNNHKINLKLAEQYRILLGLDETLQQSNFNYQHHQSIKAFIIKPTIIGSKEKIDKLVSIAAQEKVKVSISSSFESIVGLQQLQQLANHYAHKEAYKDLQISLGIDTLKYFNNGLLIDSQRIEQDCQQLEMIWTNK